MRIHHHPAVEQFVPDDALTQPGIDRCLADAKDFSGLGAGDCIRLNQFPNLALERARDLKPPAAKNADRSPKAI